MYDRKRLNADRLSVAMCNVLIMHLSIKVHQCFKACLHQESPQIKQKKLNESNCSQTESVYYIFILYLPSTI